jgi:hypothetical protein
MSSAVAKKDPSKRIVESTNGIKSEFTTKHARSWQSIFVPRGSSMKVRAVAVRSGAVGRLGTSSTSWRMGTGLKEWMPMTCCVRVVSTPSFITGIDGVFVVSTAPALLCDNDVQPGAGTDPAMPAPIRPQPTTPTLVVTDHEPARGSARTASPSAGACEGSGHR